MDEEFIRELVGMAAASGVEIVIPPSPFRDLPIPPRDPDAPVFIDYIDVIRLDVE